MFLLVLKIIFLDMQRVSQNSNWISMLRFDTSASQERLKRNANLTDLTSQAIIQRRQRSLSRPKGNSLEIENQKLKEMLDVERKALYDEEIVRQLATRLYFK